MYQAKVIPTEHKDIIHDGSFDFYGRRMATCSSDHTVKVRLFVTLLTRISFCMDLILQTITSKLLPLVTFFGIVSFKLNFADKKNPNCVILLLLKFTR